MRREKGLDGGRSAAPGGGRSGAPRRARVPEEHRRHAPPRLGFAVLTVSDSRTEATDDSGRRIVELAAAAGHEVKARRLVPDEPRRARKAVEDLLGVAGVDVVVVTGGTGFAPRDRTVAAVEPVLETRVDGFGELFRMLSYGEVGAAAMLSRALAGVVGRRAVFVLPGSPGAVALAMERLILPEAGHLVAQLRRPVRRRGREGGSR